MVSGLKCHGLAKVYHSSGRHFGKCEAGVRPANVDGYQSDRAPPLFIPLWQFAVSILKVPQLPA